MNERPEYLCTLAYVSRICLCALGADDCHHLPTMSATPVSVILGTMTIGPAVGDEHSKSRDWTDTPAYCQTPPEDALEQLNMFTSAPQCALSKGFGVAPAGKFLVDTASIYQNNHTEKVLGDLLQRNPALKEKISLHTKIHKLIKPHGKLSRVAITEVVEKSLQNLQVESLDLLYFHGPDIDTPIEESLAAVDELYRSGKVL